MGTRFADVRQSRGRRDRARDRGRVGASRPTGSAIEAALDSDGTIDITTTGARTGLPRRTEIWFLRLEDRTFITGTPGPRAWYANLRADERFTFHLKESVTVDLPARGVPVTDPALRRWVFEQPHRWNDWYRAQSSLESLVADAPMVEVLFTETPA